MTLAHLATRCLAIGVLLGWSFGEPCFAQRGDREGGGQSGRADSGDRGGGSANREQSNDSRSRSSNSSRGSQSFRRDGSSQQNAARPSSPGSPTARQGATSDRSREQQSFSRGTPGSPTDVRRDGDSNRARSSEQQSFFRGSPSNQTNGRRDSDLNRLREQQSFYRGTPGIPTDNRRDGEVNRDRDRDREQARNRYENNNETRRDSDWQDRVFGDLSDRDRSRFQNDRDGSDRIATRVREDWNRRDRDDLPFRYGWWDKHRSDRWPIYSPWGYSRWRDQPYFWWGWTPSTRLTNWFVYGWDRPSYWAYGPGRNIYYQDNYVYYDGARYMPVDDYYRQIHALAHSVPQIDPTDAEKMDWAPLGVFAVMPEVESQSADTRTLQLAVNKDGVLSGTYYNDAKGEVHPLAGMVDKRNQRAAWAFADGENPEIVFETSIFNLTKRESTMMVHFGPKAADTQVWRLVRLERPELQPTDTSTSQPQRRYDLP